MRIAVIRIALWLCLCLVLFALAETALAVYTPFESVARGDRIVLPASRRLLFEQGGKGRRFRSSSWISAKLDPVIVHTKNSLGLRGVEPPADFDKPLTLVTVGGSTTECFYLSDGKTWPDRLAAALSRPFAPVWLNNAGLDGHSTFGHMVLMEDYVAPLKPKVVLFLFGLNDVHANQPLAADRRVQRGLDVSSPKRLLISAANHSAVFALALNLYRHARASMFGLNYNPDFDLRTVGSRAVSEADMADARREHAGRLAAFRQRVERLVAISRANGIEPVLITQPALYGRGRDDGTGVDLETIAVRDTNAAVAWATLEMYNSVTRQVGVRERLLVVDLANRLEKSSRYFYDFYHYTNEGAIRVAELIYESLCPFLARKFPQYVQMSCGAAPPAARPPEHVSQPRLTLPRVAGGHS